jgi:hypothetical protein
MWPLVLFLVGEFFKNQKINVANFHEGSQKLHMCCKFCAKQTLCKSWFPEFCFSENLGEGKSSSILSAGPKY